MPTSLQNILSRVQRTIDDEEFVKVKRAELIDYIDDAIHAISSVVRVWIEQVRVAPYSAAEDYTVANEAAMLALVGMTALQTCLVTDTGERWRYYNGAWEPAPYHVVKIDPDVTRIAKMLQVWRGNNLGTEVSWQALQLGYSSGYLFPDRTNNETRSSTGVQFASVRRPDDGIDLHFTRQFALSEVCTVVYLREKPYEPEMWKDAIQIPDTVAAAVEWQTKARVFEGLYLQGDETKAQRAVYAKQRAEEETTSANAYLRNLLNEDSVVRTRPLLWLPKGDR